MLKKILLALAVVMSSSQMIDAQSKYGEPRQNQTNNSGSSKYGNQGTNSSQGSSKYGQPANGAANSKSNDRRNSPQQTQKSNQKSNGNASRSNSGGQRQQQGFNPDPYGTQMERQRRASSNSVEKEMEAYERSLYAQHFDVEWHNTRYQNIGYILDHKLTYTDTENPIYEEYGKYKIDLGATLQFGNSFTLPSKPLLGMVKFGFDITWVDLSLMKYKYNDPSAITTPDNPEIPDEPEYPDYPDYPSYAPEIGTTDAPLVQKNMMQLQMGCGVGASVHIAPFGRIMPKLSDLRIKAYARYNPTFSAFTFDQPHEMDDETSMKITGAYMGSISYGASIDYKWVGIGFETRSGSAEYKDFLHNTDDKVKLKSAYSCIYLSLHF